MLNILCFFSPDCSLKIRSLSLLYLSSNHFFHRRNEIMPLQKPPNWQKTTTELYFLLIHFPTGARRKKKKTLPCLLLINGFYWFGYSRRDKRLHPSTLVKGHGNDAQRLWWAEWTIMLCQSTAAAVISTSDCCIGFVISLFSPVTRAHSDTLRRWTTFPTWADGNNSTENLMRPPLPAWG